MKSLIVYFSRAGENYVSGALKKLEVGNTQAAAEILRELTGADIARLEPVSPYPDSYNDCIEQARREKQSNARPPLKSLPQNLEEYDRIYLGYPNYWGTMPMCVFTFLESCSLDGKTIKPFCTHEGSGLGSSVSDIKRLCPNAVVEAGLAIHGSHISGAKSQFEKWI